MVQPSLFADPSGRPESKPPGDLPERLTVLVTVKAAPNPSLTYGETVCVAGLRIDGPHSGWVRLYPLNFRELDGADSFVKYDVIELEARPARRGDSRVESWRPNWESIRRTKFLKPWSPRRPWIEEHIEYSMCQLYRDAKANPQAKSLALVKPKSITGFDVRAHGGWSRDDQRRIDSYVKQLPLVEQRHQLTPLQAPRFKGWYKYICHEPGCPGHRQQLLDWELVTFQRHWRHHSDDGTKAKLRAKFLEEMCAADRDVAFYVGNQAKRAHVFSCLGVYWPKKQ